MSSPIREQLRRARLAAVVKEFGVEPDDASDLLHAMANCWAGIGTDFTAAFQEGYEDSWLGPYDSEAEMVAEATMDAGGLPDFMPGGREQYDRIMGACHRSRKSPTAMGRALWASGA